MAIKMMVQTSRYKYDIVNMPEPTNEPFEPVPAPDPIPEEDVIINIYDNRSRPIGCMQMFENFKIVHSDIEPRMKNGVQVTASTNPEKGSKIMIPAYDFFVGKIGQGWGDGFGAGSYNRKYTRNNKLDFEKSTNGRVKNTWIERGHKNFINWSLWENHGTGWGEGQPTGVFIKDGKFYGAKPGQHGYYATVATFNNVTDIYDGDELFLDRQKGIPKPGISIAAAGCYMVVKDNKLSIGNRGSSRFPFFGRVTIRETGKKMFFGGVTRGVHAPASIGRSILKHFNDQNIEVNRCALGDGGPSIGFVVDGDVKIGGERGVPVIISW